MREPAVAASARVDPRDAAARDGGAPVSVRALLGAPVRAGDLVVGVVDDVLLCGDATWALGCAVRRRGGAPGLLPWLASTLEPAGGLRVGRPLPLLSDQAASKAAASAVALRALLSGRGPHCEPVDDVLVDPLGRVVAVALAGAQDARLVGSAAARRVLAAARPALQAPRIVPLA